MAYTPASNITGSPGLSHLATVLYRKKGLNRLMTKFLFRTACEKDVLERQNGRTVQWFRYNNLSAVTSGATEGAIGTGQTISSNILQATVSQYAAFITVSDLLEATAIDPIVANAAELLGYQAGLTVDTITRAVIDSKAAATNQALLATVLRVEDLRSSRHGLQANNVQPYDDGEFLALAHPYATYDLVNDPAAVGLADIFKYNTDVKATPLVKYEDRGLVTHVAGCKVLETTNTYEGTSGGNNTYRAYVFGKGGVGTVDLAGNAPSDVKDPAKERFAIKVIRDSGSIANPTGQITAAVSYNFSTTTVILQGPAGIGGPYRYRTMDPQSSIA